MSRYTNLDRLSRRQLLLGACALAASTAAGLPLAGCGGSGRTVGVPLVGRTAHASVRIAWPSRKSRLVPVASNSIVVQIVYNGAPFTTVTVNRPADGTPSTVSFDALPLGQVLVTATAYPQADGQGTALATGTAPFLIKNGVQNALTLTMATTITAIYPFADVWRVALGATTAVTAYAFDTDGNIVLTTPGKLQWSSDHPEFVSIDSSGTARGTGIGDANITVLDTESGISGSSPLGCRTPGIEVWPDSAEVQVSTVNPQAFFALDLLTEDIVDVNWSVVEGAAGGSVDADGTYHAPATAGTYHVRAVNKADSSQTATATVVVTNASGLLPVGVPAPPIDGVTIDGNPFHLSDYRGKVVLVDFCATWCPPCGAEVPFLIDLQNTYASRGFTVVGLYVDQDTSAVPPYAAAKGINYPVLLATFQNRVDYGGIAFIPTLYLVDKNGNIAYATVGETAESVLAAQIDKII